jgi:RNA polymerase sigma-70 factor (ECF subfamily)
MRTAQLDEALIRRFHRRANADRWSLSLGQFGSVLESIAARAFTSEPPRGDQVERYLASLHLEDLALACACAEGHEAAWDHFVREHRPVLYRAADAIDRTGGTRDLADALYAELFGLTERDGERLSLFRYFHGRSSLATWLRAVLAQRHVDRIRGTRRLDPLPAEDDADAIPASVDSLEPERARFLASMRRAVAAAVVRLAPRDRLRLACYYAQDLTLAQIGRGLGEHEATSSRHLARTRRAIREDVERQLRQDEGMSEAEVGECFSSVVEDAGPLDLAEMLGGQPARKEFEPDRST